MSVKIEFEKDIHVFKGDLSNYELICQFVKKAFPDAPANFQLYYEDSDGDIITIANNEDLKVISSESKVPKLYVRQSQKSIIVPSSDDEAVEIVSKQREEKKETKRLSPSPKSPSALKPISEQDLKKILKQQKKDKKEKKLREAVQREIQSMMPQITAMVAQQLSSAPSCSTSSASSLPKPLLTSTPSCAKAPVVHEGYVCDGCDGPIIGSRFKSSVLEDFDLCEKCERQVGHEYPLIKIAHPQQAPKSILTIIDEDNNTVNTRTSDNAFLRQVIESQLCPTGDFFQEIGFDFSNGAPTHCRRSEPSTATSSNNNNNNNNNSSSSSSPSNEAVLIASVVGGAPQDYEDLVKNCQGLEIDDMIDCALALRESKKEAASTSSTATGSCDTPCPSEPVNRGFKLEEEKHFERGRKPVGEKAPVPLKSENSKKKYTWTEVNRAKEIQNVLGGEDLDFYCEIVKNNPRKPAFALIEELLDEQAIFEQVSEKKKEEKSAPVVVVQKEEKPAVVVSEKKIEIKEVPQVEIRKNSPPQNQTYPKGCLKKTYSVDFQNKAAMVASVMGGDANEYLEIVSMMPASTVEDIVFEILAEKECFGSSIRINNNRNNEEKVEKVEVKIEEMKVDEIKEKIEIKKEEEVEQKKLKKNFSNIVKQKSEKVAEVIGGNAEEYFGVCDAFCFSTVNDLVEMILNDSAVLIKYSSYASSN